MSFPRYPKYKPSGVEWLGDVPEHWDVVPPKLRARARAGGTLIKGQCADEWAEGLFPGFSASGQDVWLEVPAYEGAAIVLSAVGARCGKSFKADGAWGVVANTHCIFPREGADRNFLWYVTNEESWWEKGGSAQPFVKVNETLARKWAFPPADEQRAIAAFLDSETAKIDALVAEQERLIELLKEKRHAFIAHAVTKGLNPNAPMKDSGIEWLGPVPQHWELRRLKSILADVKTGPFGSALTKDMYTTAGFRVYGQEQVIPADFSIGDYFIGADLFSELQQYAVEPGDVLVSCVGTFGKVAVVPVGVHPGIINPRLIRLRCGPLLSSAYLALVLTSEVTFEQFAAMSRGGTMDTINGGTLSAIWAALPPPAEQEAVLRYVAHFTSQSDALVGQAQGAIDLLQERRTSLIAAAVTGQIDVRPESMRTAA